MAQSFRLLSGDGYWLNDGHTHFRSILYSSFIGRCRGSTSMEHRSYGCFCVLYLGGGFFLLHCSLPLVRDCIALGRVDLSDMGRRAHTSIPTTAASDGHPGGVDLDFLFLEHHCSCIWQFWRDCERLPFWISTVNREVARVFAFGVSRSSGRVNQHLHMKTVQKSCFLSFLVLACLRCF